MMPETIAVVDDDPDVLLATALALRPLGHDVLTLAEPEALSDCIAKRGVGVVLLDLNFERGATSSREGLRWLTQWLRDEPELVVIVVTAYADVSLAVNAMKLGATDFLSKPWTHERLTTTVRTAIALRQARRSAEQLRQQSFELGSARDAETDGMVGQSAAMQQVRSLIARVGPTDASVLILGENGTGKDLVARALHRASPRALRPMVTVDLGAVSPNLFESEIFGHRKGAFTDAKTDRIGRMAAADGSTLFLDEIGNLPLALQPKLLTALEKGEVTPVGGNSPVAINARIVCATNVAPAELADATRFRPDLLFRLNTVEIHVPPLRERRGDIVPLAHYFLQGYSAKYGKPLKAFEPEAIAAMTANAWPGNVRALRHAVERAVILSTAASYTVQDLALVADAATPLSVTDTPTAEPSFNLEQMEQNLVERALQKHAWNITLAARDLGLTRASLYRRMERFGL
jgi:DNA-binding NtrC family response regulator